MLTHTDSSSLLFSFRVYPTLTFLAFSFLATTKKNLGEFKMKLDAESQKLSQQTLQQISPESPLALMSLGETPNPNLNQTQPSLQRQVQPNRPD